MIHELYGAMLESFRQLRKFSENSPRRRRGRRGKEFLIKKYSDLCELGVSVVK